MSKEAVIIQEFNEKERKYEYFVKGFDVTESVKILLKRHKEEYDKEKNIFAGTQGFIEAQQLYEKQIADLEAKLAESEEQNKRLYNEKESAEKILRMSSNEETREILQLKQQLAEKETLIAKLEEHDEIYHNQLAIEQLELIKEKAMEQQSYGWGVKYKDRYDILMDIDNQIKQLKEGK